MKTKKNKLLLLFAFIMIFLPIISCIDDSNDGDVIIIDDGGIEVPTPED